MQEEPGQNQRGGGTTRRRRLLNINGVLSCRSPLLLHSAAALTFSPPYKSSACSARVRSCNAPPSSGLAVCAQPRPPPNVRAGSTPNLYHPPSSALLAAQWRRRQREILGQSSRALANPSGKEEEDDDGGRKRNLGAASESCIGRPPSSQPHFSSFFPHQSDTRLHHLSLTLSLGLYGKCIYTGWKSARIVGTDNYAD